MMSKWTSKIVKLTNDKVNDISKICNVYSELSWLSLQFNNCKSL